MDQKTRDYWRLKNRIGYAVISGDKEKKRELEDKLKKGVKSEKES